MADARKSRCRHRRRRRVGLGLRGGAGQGRQEGRAAGQRAGLAARRPHQLRHLGPPHQAGGAPFILEGKQLAPIGYQGGWGVGGAALHYFANFPRLLPNDFKIKSEHDRALDWPISYADVAPYYDKVAHDVGVSGDAKAEELWRPAGRPIRCRR